MKKYIALFEYDEAGGYAVTFPDLPGLASAGDDYDEAFRMAHEALALHLEGLKVEGYPIPAPRSLERIKAEWEDWAEWEREYQFLVVPIVALPSSDRSVRVNITLPEGLLVNIDAVAKNRSEFLASAARHYMSEEPQLRKQA